MSEVTTEPTPITTENPSLAEQMAQMESADQATTQQPLNVDTPSEQENLIAGKFKSQEDLVEAYKNLESKLGQPEAKEQPPIDTTEDAVDKASEEGLKIEKQEVTQNDVIQKASQEFWENGEIGADSYKALEDMGLNKDVVDQFAEAQKAKQQLQQYQAAELRNSAFQQVGGEENYKAMGEWAAANLSDGELSAYNENVNSGDPNKINLAVNALYSKYSNSNTVAPNNKISGMSATTGITPFQSDAQQRAAQADPRYATDPAYRQQVDSRIAAGM